MASVAFDDRRSGPHDHASRLYEEHGEWLLSYCLRQLRGRADAEDAVQTTFLYAFRALRRGVVPECERAWLTTIAKNVCHTHRRTDTRRPETENLDLDRIALAQPDLEEAGFLDDVRSALAALPDAQRRALVLREWQGLRSSEIATELHLSEAATHALLHRARRSFATAMSASRRPLVGLNVVAILDQLRSWLKPFLGGTAAKAAVVTTAAGVAVGGGVVLEQRIGDRTPPTPAAAASAAVPAQVERSSQTVPTASREANPRRVVQAPPERESRRARDAADPAPTSAAPRDETGAGARRPADVPSVPAPSSPTASESPGPAPSQPVPLPPVAPPTVVPPGLPPILAHEPPVDLPPPLDELVPPVEVPPLPPLPEPELPLP